MVIKGGNMKNEKSKKTGVHKTIAIKIIMVVLFVSGLMTFAYPFLSDAINGLHDQAVIDNYKKEYNDLSKQEQENRLNKLKIENKKLLENNELTNIPGMGTVKDPFASESKKSELANKDNVKKHIIGAIFIPAIKVSLPLFDETNDAFLDEGATVLQGSSFPIGGIGTHSVITGHTGVPEKKLFTDLNKLKKGDVFYIQVEGKKLAYQINNFKTVLPNELDSLKIDRHLDQVTLVTCTPYMINTHRLLVTGYRVPYVGEKLNQQINATKQYQFKRIMLYSFLLLVLVLFIIYIFWRILFKSKKENSIPTKKP